jgi:hypothetical protein
MDDSPISQDDIIDVVEMTQKLEDYFERLFYDNEQNLAMSAVMNACASTIFNQSKTLKEVLFYIDIFMQILDDGIHSAHIRRKPD